MSYHVQGWAFPVPLASFTIPFLLSHTLSLSDRAPLTSAFTSLLRPTSSEPAVEEEVVADHNCGLPSSPFEPPSCTDRGYVVRVAKLFGLSIRPANWSAVVDDPERSKRPAVTGHILTSAVWLRVSSSFNPGTLFPGLRVDLMSFVIRTRSRLGAGRGNDPRSLLRGGQRQPITNANYVVMS